MLTHAVYDTMTGEQVTDAMDATAAEIACKRLGGLDRGYAVKWVQSAPKAKPADEAKPADDGPGLFD